MQFLGCSTLEVEEIVWFVCTSHLHATGRADTNVTLANFRGFYYFYCLIAPSSRSWWAGGFESWVPRRCTKADCVLWGAQVLGTSWNNTRHTTDKLRSRKRSKKERGDLPFPLNPMVKINCRLVSWCGINSVCHSMPWPVTIHLKASNHLSSLCTCCSC